MSKEKKIKLIKVSSQETIMDLTDLLAKQQILEFLLSYKAKNLGDLEIGEEGKDEVDEKEQIVIDTTKEVINNDMHIMENAFNTIQEKLKEIYETIIESSKINKDTIETLEVDLKDNNVYLKAVLKDRDLEVVEPK